MKLEQLFSILPNRNGCTEFGELLKIFVKERLNPGAKLTGVELHECNMEGRRLCRPHFLRTPRSECLDLRSVPEPLPNQDPSSQSREKMDPF